MALTLTNSNYGGEVLQKIYLEIGLGNEIAKEAICEIVTDQAGTFSLPKMSQTSLPIGVYTAGSPSGDTATTSWAERSLSMSKMTVYETLYPDSFHGQIWKLWESKGDFTNLENNSKLMKAILDLYKDNIGRHYSLLAFQGNTDLGAGTKMHYFDGWVTRAKSDPNVIKPTPAGDITASNFVDILASVWQAIPSHLFKDPDFTLKVSTTMWKLFQTSNLDIKKAFAGVLGMGLDDKFLTSKIIPFDGMQDHHILGSRSNNLYAGFWVEPTAEGVRIDRKDNDSRTWFLRIDMKADVNYVSPTEIVLYEPTATL